MASSQENDHQELLEILKNRFEKNSHRHNGISWAEVEKKLLERPEKLQILLEMEKSGGEPDVVNLGTMEIIFADCAAESPNGRRSLCYDAEALASRKAHKPKHSAVGMASDFGARLLTESEYLQLQTLEKFDQKTSSWLATPAEVRKLGGAIFGDRRFDRVFIYHNGAESYYASRGFRAVLEL